MTMLCTAKVGDRDDGPVIATLGDPLASTCSMEFAREYLSPGSGRIDGYASFEEAAAAVLLGNADTVLVPSAYPRADLVIQNDDLYLDDLFRAQMPDIVAIGRAEKPRKLYYHAALTRDAGRLLSQWNRMWGPDWSDCVKRITVDSNPVACQKVLADPEAAGLTNVIAARAYGTPVGQTMGAGRAMPCVLYAASTVTKPQHDRIR
jgi:hypothetical protein